MLRESTDHAFTASNDETSRQAQQSICLLVELAAQANELPTEFFVRLIWQESRFRAGAIGPSTRTGKHAQGIAQFMPGTAAERDLLDRFNPIEALPKAAEFLKDLRSQFGNLGLAAAAYNAGPGRVRAWMAGTSSMPAQTRAYVLAVTGNSIEEWATGRDVKSKNDSESSCSMLMARLKQPPTTFLGALQQRVVAGAIQPWGAILGANQSRSEILDRYAALQRKFAAALAGLDPIIFERTRAADCLAIKCGSVPNRARPQTTFAKKFIFAGGDCVVLRNPGS